MLPPYPTTLRLAWPQGAEEPATLPTRSAKERRDDRRGRLDPRRARRPGRPGAAVGLRRLAGGTWRPARRVPALPVCPSGSRLEGPQARRAAAPRGGATPTPPRGDPAVATTLEPGAH